MNEAAGGRRDPQTLSVINRYLAGIDQVTGQLDRAHDRPCRHPGGDPGTRRIDKLPTSPDPQRRPTDRWVATQLQDEVVREYAPDLEEPQNFFGAHNEEAAVLNRRMDRGDTEHLHEQGLFGHQQTARTRYRHIRETPECACACARRQVCIQCHRCARQNPFAAFANVRSCRHGDRAARDLDNVRRSARRAGPNHRAAIENPVDGIHVQPTVPPKGQGSAMQQFAGAEQILFEDKILPGPSNERSVVHKATANAAAPADNASSRVQYLGGSQLSALQQNLSGVGDERFAEEHAAAQPDGSLCTDQQILDGEERMPVQIQRLRSHVGPKGQGKNLHIFRKQHGVVPVEPNQDRVERARQPGLIPVQRVMPREAVAAGVPFENIGRRRYIEAQDGFRGVERRDQQGSARQGQAEVRDEIADNAPGGFEDFERHSGAGHKAREQRNR